MNTAISYPASERASVSSFYRYSPLGGPEQIRLLQIKPGTEYEPIVCEIHHVNLADHPFYEALSYTWDTNERTGVSAQFDAIICGEARIGVAPNLFSALNHLRKKSGDLILWVDAVCINQADNRERGQQVQIMNRIYTNCSRALVWLGQQGSEDSSALDLARSIGSLCSILPEESRHRSLLVIEALRTGILPSWKAPQWEALAFLLDRPWFYRVWVI
jgi:hypothetical protein